MVTRATVTSSKTADFSFRGPLGFEAHTVLLSVESDSPDQYTFESVGGNINLMGIVDFAEIRPNCTEVTLAVHSRSGTSCLPGSTGACVFSIRCDCRTAQHPRAEKRQDGFPHVGCVGTQDRCQSNRYAEPLEQRRADGMNDSSFIANGGNFTFPDKANVRPERLFFRLPLDRINWLTSCFLIGTLALTLTAVPLYLWFFGLDWFQVVLFFAMLAACGFSVTLGYHRLFSHITFQASWPIRLFTLIFGAAAFENSVLMWASEHRRHHKHVDHDDDPYCISKGFFYAHIGWLLFKLNTDQPVRQRSRPAERQARLLARSTRPMDRGPRQLRHPGHPRLSVEWMAWSARCFLDRGGCANRCAAALHISD